MCLNELVFFQVKSVEGSKIFLTKGQWDVVEIVGYDDEFAVM